MAEQYYKATQEDSTDYYRGGDDYKPIDENTIAYELMEFERMLGDLDDGYSVTGGDASTASHELLYMFSKYDGSYQEAPEQLDITQEYEANDEFVLDNGFDIMTEFE